MISENIGRVTNPVASNESVRQYELDQYHILDTPTEKEFDDLAQLASYICETPISAVSLVDHDRQWFKSIVGLDIEGTPRDQSICAHTILSDELFVVPDLTKDARFDNNPLVTSDPNLRFYAGAPLMTLNGFAIGALCVIDRRPRELNAAQLDALRALSRTASTLLEYHRIRRDFINAVTDRSENWDSLVEFSRDDEPQSTVYPNAGLVGASVLAGGFIGYALGAGKRNKPSK